MRNNYDPVAGIYDQLAGLVFGRALIRAQVYLLSFIPPGSRVLIAGGGTGWILEKLALHHPSGLAVTYVELSGRMLARARGRDCGGNKVTFIHQAVETFHDDPYDVVITPFLLDNFSPDQALSVFRHLDGLLRPGGLWLFADFRQGEKQWQRLLLRAMLLFFRLVCRIGAKQLTNMDRHFRESGFTTVAHQAFYGNFITSVVYKKKPHDRNAV